MKRTCFYFIALLTLIFVGCTSDDAALQTGERVAENPYFVSLDEAIENARCLFNATRTDRSFKAKVSSVEYLMPKPGQATRSTENEPSCQYYVVNFGNEEGFAILSADKRMLPVYAFSDEGSISINDTIENPGLKQYLEGITCGAAGIGGGNNTFPNTPPTYDVVGISCRPLLNENVRKWHQGSPYNAYCPLINNSRAVVGCLPLAIGMITSYFEYPASFNGISLNWSNIKSGNDNETLAKFLKYIGDPQNCNANYHPNGTGASWSNTFRTLGNLGYIYAEDSAFTMENVNNDLKNSKPVLVYSHYGSNHERAHAWVIDGMRFLTTRHVVEWVDGQDPVYEYRTTYYPHCVWGWGGKGNGYFAYSGVISGHANYLAEGEEYYTVAPYDFFLLINKITI